MKLMTSLIIASLFSISCNKNKLQKNSAFKPVCEANFSVSNPGSVTCTSGSSACGTKFGSGTMNVYCIDESDTILTTAKCSNGDVQPVCEQLLRN